MKPLYRIFAISIIGLTLTCAVAGLYLKGQNKHLNVTTSNFSELLQEERRLSDKNALLKKKWNVNNDVLAELSKFLILPQKETANTPVDVYDPETQSNISVYENYLSGFVAYDDCVKVLEKLCEAQLPILITSLSIHRNIAHNYALQLSMTYRTK